MNILSVLIILFSLVSNTNEPTEPFLFKIERSLDADAIYYQVNTDSNGNLNIEKPVNVFWLRHARNSEKEPLTWIQENYSYGIEVIACTENAARLQFVSYDKRDLILKRNKRGQFRIYIKQNEQFQELNKVHIQIDGGTFWIPEIKKVDLYTTNYKTLKPQLETITP